MAQTTGSAVAGGLVALVTAPFALLLGAITHFISATVLLTLKHVAAETPLAHTPEPLRRKVREGLRWIYRHPRFGPLAWSSHAWFIGSAMMGAVLPVLVLNDLGLGALGLGLVLTVAGIGSVIGTVIGTVLSVWIGQRWGTGLTMVIARFVQPPVLALVISGFRDATVEEDQLTDDEALA
ncbi:hypothetical protein BG28_02185 [Nesterenkonia sp. AN1]|uniref:MFS transporter n=1 Tax=Nesterenkonia sp. AN1 TaxID=652017 RepID=UPI00044B7477|nr:MFS transporter [Nesterenkonia sp. AN1]EXF25102.1 hypothetical protein BG28_02185 [Nesterenkonia sp. AN1]